MFYDEGEPAGRTARGRTGKKFLLRRECCEAQLSGCGWMFTGRSASVDLLLGRLLVGMAAER